jgi:hypothetical protein
MKDLIKITGISQQPLAHYNPILFGLEVSNGQQRTGTLIEKCFKSLTK